MPASSPTRSTAAPSSSPARRSSAATRAPSPTCFPRKPASSSAPRPGTTWNARWRRTAPARLRSRAATTRPLLNVDIGGGTTKFALIENGPHPRHLRHRGRRPAAGRRRRERPHPHRAAGRRGRQGARHRARARQAAGARGSPPHRRPHGAHRHGHDRSAPAGRAGALAARDRDLAGRARQQGHRRHDLFRRRRGVSLQARDARLRRSRLRPRRGAAPCAGAPPRPAAGLGSGPGHPRDRHRRRAILGADQRQHHPDQPTRQAAAAEPAGAVMQFRTWTM